MANTTKIVSILTAAICLGLVVYYVNSLSESDELDSWQVGDSSHDMKDLSHAGKADTGAGTKKVSKATPHGSNLNTRNAMRDSKPNLKPDAKPNASKAKNASLQPGRGFTSLAAVIEHISHRDESTIDKEKLSEFFAKHTKMFESLTQRYFKEENRVLKEKILFALEQVAAPQKLEYALELMLSPEQDVRQLGYQWLAQVGAQDPLAGESLVQASYEETDASGLIEISSGLLRMSSVSDDAQAQVYFERLRELSDAPQEAVALHAFSLVTSQSQDTLSYELVKDKLAAESPKMKQAAITALFQFGRADDQALAALQAIVNDTSETRDLRQMAYDIHRELSVQVQ